MTPRERFLAALKRRPLPGRVPHFELVFFLTMEAFGRLHPSQRHFGQWGQMEEKERRLHLRDIADLYIAIAERYEHSAIFVQYDAIGWNNLDIMLRVLEHIRELSGDKYFLMVHGDATFGIPHGNDMEAFSFRIADEPEKLHAEAEAMINDQLARAERFRRHGALDGFALCSDYCLNTGPFLSPDQFSEFVTPYLAG